MTSRQTEAEALRRWRRS